MSDDTQRPENDVPHSSDVTFTLEGVELAGDLTVPTAARGLIVFAHGSGSSRHSPRNQQVAAGLHDAGFATLLFDLLTEAEAVERRNVFDVATLARRLADVVGRVREHDEVTGLPVGLFGASTGAAAALEATVHTPAAVSAIVSRGGRPDLATRLADVTAPVLLVVGGEDGTVIGVNRSAADQLTVEHEIEIVPGAGHLFDGPGELEQVTEFAASWFTRHLGR